MSLNQLHIIKSGTNGFEEDLDTVITITDSNISFTNRTLEISSTAGGLILPRMDSTAMSGISSPAAGELLYNTTENKFFGFSYGRWASLRSAAPPAITDANQATAVALWFSDESAATATYGHISTWDVSAVTDMNGTFKDKTSFNEDISAWDVGNVTDMGEMFNDAEAFNQDIGSWEVSNVTNMSKMFREATAFNQDGDPTTNQTLNEWDVSNVINMAEMFRDATSFNQSIPSWDTSAVTDMNNMFRNATAMDQDLSSWTVTAITDHSDWGNGAHIGLVAPSWP